MFNINNFNKRSPKIMYSLNRSHNHILISLKSNKKAINIEQTKYPIIKEIAVRLDFQISEDVYNFLWTDHALTIKQIREENPATRVNHIPDITQITRKNKMATNLNALKNYFPRDYNFYPETWMVPIDHDKLMKKHTRGKIYICKPENGCQGQGIYLIDNPNKLQRYNNEVVQQYIMNPYLIDGLKFDLRIYALITCVNPLRVYVYNDGIVRFATQRFQRPNESNLDNFFSHLTNYAINKANQNFKVDDNNLNEGHKRLLTSVFKNEEYASLMHKINQIIIKTIISGLPYMQNGFTHCKKNDPNACFQLLGFDIMLSDKKEPILLQVNQNPSLVTDTQLDYNLKSQMVKNIFEMITGGYSAAGEEKMETKIKMKDRHQAAFKGNFAKIYPCSTLEETEEYDEFIIRSNSIYKERFGINFGKSTRKTHYIARIQEQPILWSEQPNRYTKDKVERVYRARVVKTSNFSNNKRRQKEKLIFV